MMQMVANAGIALNKPLEQSELRACRLISAVCVTDGHLTATVEEWDRLFSVNARGTFLCYKYAAIQMIKQGRGGRIIGT